MKPLLILTGLNCVVCCFFIFKSRLDEYGPPPPPPNPAAEREWKPFDLDDEPDKLKLTDYLEKPRAELARLCLELEDQIRNQEKKRQAGDLPFKTLPPSTRFSMVWPIWREARYSSQRDMVLPPYLSETGHDSQLALHLAHFGDVEAARKIVEPGDTATLEEIDRLALRRNYPAEWTRLVAMILHQAHFDLAESNNHAARKVVALHRQLAALFSDNESRETRLATTLLSRGQLVLQEAVMAWLGQVDQEEWVDLGSRALSEWGDFAVPVLPPARSPQEFARWLGGRHSGLLVSSGDTLRALDMLELPLPTEAVEGVVGLFEPNDKLREILVVYGQMHDLHEVKRLTYWLDEQIASSAPLHVRFRLEQFPDPKSKEVVAPLAVVRLGTKTAEPRSTELPRLPRDLGLVDLDRTFEINRRYFAWMQSGSRLTVADPGLLANLKWPYADQKFAQANMTRDGQGDVVSDLQLTLEKDPAGRGSLIGTASPIWQLVGASRFHVTGSTGKDTFNLVWSDGSTEMSLCFPHNQEAAFIELRDDSGLKVEKRLQAAQKRDAEERLARWTEGKLLTRVQRKVDLFQLGMTRADLEIQLKQRKALRSGTKSGDLLTFPGLAHEGAEWIARQALVRFDESGRLTEARVRFTDVPPVQGAQGNKPGSVLQLLGSFSGASGGHQLVAETDKSPGDAKVPAKVMRWQDDATFLQARVNASGIEVVLKDCPREHAHGLPLPPAKWLPEGPGPECLLGASKTDVFAHWNLVNPPPMSEGGIGLGTSEKSPYDAYFVFFTADKVTRILARHRQTGETLTQPAQAEKAVKLAWGQHAQAYSWPWQQAFNKQGILKAWSTQDDATQLKVYWQLQQIDSTFRVYTEWK